MQQPTGDWHPADIVAALHKKGWSLSRLSVAHGYEKSACTKAHRGPWRAIEQIIADAIGVPPATIWPSRYDGNGEPLQRRRSKPSTRRRRRNVRSGRAAQT
ncbi:MAG: helix-turn-helix domain-containing protein [Alphaproteobacteria bacterium]